MTEQSEGNGPSSEPNAKPQEEKLKQSKVRRLPTRVVCVFIFGIIGGAICFYGASLLNAQFFICGWLIIWIGAIFECSAARLWIINHKIKHPMPGWLDSNITFLVVILVCGIACAVAASISSKANQPKPTSPMVVQNFFPVAPNYIDGTQITEEWANEKFSFGYAIIYYGQNKILRYDVITNGLMDWKLDMEKVQIEVDYSDGTVKWTLPNFGASSPFGDHIETDYVTLLSVFKKGAYTKNNLFQVQGRPFPILYAVTLSDDQRQPVFLIGYRIPTKDDFK